MIDLFQELRDVTAALQKKGIRYAIVGGLAYSALVRSRSTEDIDLLILPDDWERIKELLRGLGYEDLAGPMDFKNIRIRRLVKLEEGDSLVLDFLFAESDRLIEGIDRGIRIGRGDYKYFVAPPDVIILLKQQRMSDIDKSDIEGLRKLIEDQES